MPVKWEMERQRMYSMLKLDLTRNSWLLSARDRIPSFDATINADQNDEIAQIYFILHRHVDSKRALAPDARWFSDPREDRPLWVSKTPDQACRGGGIVNVRSCNSSRCENQQVTA